MISPEKIQKLPDVPGVYLFKDAKGGILYVGKATSLRNRVRSYFAGNLHETRGPLVVKLVEIAEKIDVIETDTVLEALILEAKLIKKYQPYHNTKEKDDKSFNGVVITNERFPRLLVVRGREIQDNFDDPAEYKAVFGPFPNGGSLREALKIIRRIFPYRDSKCTPAEELPSGKNPRPCFNRQIGLCPGVCTGEISAKDYARIVKHIMMFFDGKKKELLKSLEKDMKTYAKNHEFEKAAEVKKTIFALKHIQDVALIRREKTPEENLAVANTSAEYVQNNNRIEAYDIAHLSGTSVAGVMTVVENGESVPAQYRMFKIRQAKGGDDLQALKEVLTRRFNHREWGMPAIIVIDGGETHLKYAKEKLEELGIFLPVVSVVKDQSHKPKDILGDGIIAAKYNKEILLVNSEAHRFAIKYHKNLRGKSFLS